MRRSLRLLPVLLVVAACARSDEQRDLAAALEQQYHTSATVRRSDSTQLMVILHGLPDSAIDRDSSGKAAFARTVASYAKAHYARRSELTNVGVVFVGTAQGQPVMVATPGNGPFRFATSELP
jgi:hypothetical protein